ncbi:hypothetical protein CRM22_009490 [Opisthorchis felineus]|uniref:Uncharacterized protein n=1 Tax=Opisthorchis felineus TaxID=147828 RepID=A0A4S2L7F6_OPIFE|nr:hypothetical protein CRM22_009490 [Opisthorchis felineus]
MSSRSAVRITAVHPFGQTSRACPSPGLLSSAAAPAPHTPSKLVAPFLSHTRTSEHKTFSYGILPHDSSSCPRKQNCPWDFAGGMVVVSHQIAPLEDAFAALSFSLAFRKTGPLSQPSSTELCQLLSFELTRLPPGQPQATVEDIRNE